MLNVLKGMVLYVFKNIIICFKFNSKTFRQYSQGFIFSSGESDCSLVCPTSQKTIF